MADPKYVVAYEPAWNRDRTGLDFDELIERSSVGSPAWKHFQEQGEEIVRRVKRRESGES
jgi:hypothetical protein